jgi:SAM-dependent methyltransferase
MADSANKPQPPDASRRRHAPAAERNREPILAVLREHLPHNGRALEIASGTGQHATAFARAFPGIEWLASDPDASARESIAAWAAETGVSNLAAPLDLDVTAPDWFEAFDASFDAVLAINLIHIAPWTATEGLLKGAGALLRREGVLYLYGPYRRGGEHTAESNAAFDAQLRAQNPAWGIRDIDEVERAAAAHGLRRDAVVAMPANNFSLVFRKA